MTPVTRGGHFTFTAFVRDISEKKKIEEDKKNEKELLQNALKLRAEFISICSHELNTPITSMKLQFQMAKRAIEQGREQVLSFETTKRRVEMTIGQIERMSRLISDMLDVSKISTVRLEFVFHPVDIVKVVKDVVERFQDQFEREGTKFNFTPSLETAVVDGDQYRLEQVVSNLATNAMKYGEGKPILIKIETEGDNFHLSVKDEGMGIDKENLSKIFSKFERAIVPNDISGLGLGLYISKQIVDSHRGKRHVESHKGQGSTFTVIISALKQKPHAPIG